MNKPLPISIIIPAYNEERYLGACLDSISAQIDMPLEVLLVDNNSTDRTVDVAKGYPFVRILHEKRQHQAYAQATGFTAAKGAIFARIDADSVLPPQWTRQVAEFFEANPRAVAFSGHPDPYDAPLKKAGVFVFDIFHAVFTRWHAGHMVLYGSNCAFRGKLWPKIRHRLHLRPDIWEDYDLGFALGRHGYIANARHIVVGCSFRALQQPFRKQLRYQMRAVRTFWLNTSWWRTGLQFGLRALFVFVWPYSVADRIYVRVKHLIRVR